MPTPPQRLAEHLYTDHEQGIDELGSKICNRLQPYETLEQAAQRCTKQMHAAIKDRDLSTLKAVFDQGAINVMAEMQLTESTSALPFHHAAMRGDLDVMKFLM